MRADCAGHADSSTGREGAGCADPSPLANIFDAQDLMFVWDKDNFAEIKNKPNGTGPFKLAEWLPGNQIRLVRHDGFYKSGLPYLDEVILKVFPDYEALVIALETGAVDVTSRLRGRDKRRLEQRQDLKVVVGKPGVTIFTLAIQSQRPPFADRRVRQAISYALSRQRFVDTYLDGLGESWSLPWPPHSPAYDPAGSKAHAQNLDQAKRLLAEAGYSGDFEATIIANRTRAGLTELAELTQNDLGQIGIRGKILTLEEAAWQPRYREGDFDIAPNSTGRTSKHPASLFSLNVNFGAQRNNSQFQSDEYKRLAALSLTTFDPTEAKRVYDQLNTMILDESFNPVIAPQTKLWGLRGHVMGYDYTLDGWDVMEAAWLNRSAERELIPACLEHGIGLVPYSPLAGGMLTGKYREGEPPPAGTRAVDNPRVQERFTARGFAIVGRLREWAEARGHTIAELAIAWLAAQPVLSTIIAGARRAEQLEPNVRAAEWKLSPDDLREIDELSEWPTGPGALRPYVHPEAPRA